MDVSTQMRLTGLASGLDTDEIIRNLGKAHTIKIDAVKREKQLAVWKQEMYRGTIDMLSNFQKTFFDYTKPSTNFLSPSSLAKFTYNLSLGGDAAAAAKIMSVTANGDLTNFNQSVQAVAQLATKDTWNGSTMDLQGMRSSGFDIENFASVVSISEEDKQDTIKLAMEQKYFRDVYIENDPDGLFQTWLDKPENAGKDKDNWMEFLNENGGRTFLTETWDDAVAANDPAIDDIIDEVEAEFADVNWSDYDKVTFKYAFFGLSIDGVSRTIDISDDQLEEIYKNNTSQEDRAKAFAELFNKRIADEFGKDFNNLASAVEVGSGADKRWEIKIDKAGSNITIFEVAAFKSVEQMGFVTGASNRNFGGKTVGELFPLMFGGDGNHALETEITINNEKITINSTDTISTMMSKINSSKANVNLTYDVVNDKFVMTSNGEGTISDINVTMAETRGGTTTQTASGAFFYALGMVHEDVNEPSGLAYTDRKKAQNLRAVINGQEIVKFSNAFTMDGMNYTFNETFNSTIDNDGKIVVTDPSQEIKIQVKKNTEEIVSSIKNFVDEYNKIVAHLNSLMYAKRERDTTGAIKWPPLTDDEKKAMSEDEIKSWEEKAKTGILGGDMELRQLLDQMRMAIYQTVDGAGISMAEIGITTTTNYMDGGLLSIDEDKLKLAIEGNYDSVVRLFTQRSDIPYGSAGGTQDRNQRYKDNGIAARLDDIIKDAARTTTVNGKKGSLVEKAGLKNDGSATTNQITKQIEQYDKRINTLLDRWKSAEDALYQKFARMETAMMKLQSQQNNLASLMAGNGQ